MSSAASKATRIGAFTGGMLAAGVLAALVSPSAAIADRPRDGGTPDTPPLGRRVVADLPPSAPAVPPDMLAPAAPRAPLPRTAPVDEPPPTAAPSDKKTPVASENVRLSSIDRATLQKLHDMNLTEIQMGGLAKTRGFSKATRGFGARLSEDHRLVERKLDGYLRSHRSSLGALGNSSADADHVLLATRNGADFDREFALQMIADHTKAIDVVQAAIDETFDENLRAVYQQILPVLQAHKRAAQDIVSGASGQ